MLPARLAPCKRVSLFRDASFSPLTLYEVDVCSASRDPESAEQIIFNVGFEQYELKKIDAGPMSGNFMESQKVAPVDVLLRRK